jgi:hypothetical protein
MRCGNSFPRRASFACAFSFVLALPALLLVPGRALLWPQESGPSSRSSAGRLAEWEKLSGEFTLNLERHEQTLKELGRKLQTSEASLQQLTPLYELSLQQNGSLKTYNAQIAERMQARDEDLAASYEANGRKDKAILRLVIAVILLSIPYLIKAALWIAGKFKP